MKKSVIMLVVMVSLVWSISYAAYAENTKEIIEVPAVKIIMDGKLTQYEYVPISIKSNTLLPLRELLVNLGVPDDNEHIAYNNEEKSVTILKDQTRIYLAAGNQTAYVNDQPIRLNVAPVIYDKNGRIYIPLRFVAEALDKKVVWDGSNYAIFICGITKFDSIKQILDRSDEAMKLANKYRQTIDVDTTAKSEQINMTIKVNAEVQIDKAYKKMYVNTALNMLGIEMKADTYYVSNVAYIQNSFNQTWQKKTYLQPDYDKLFASQSSAISLEVNEPLCAGLTQVPGKNPDEILLKGDVYLKELFKKVLSNEQAGNSLISEKDMDFNTFNIEISLNTDTYLVNSILMNVGSVHTANKETVTTDVSVKVLYSDYNGDFQIIVPEDVMKNAVEMKNATIFK